MKPIQRHLLSTSLIAGLLALATAPALAGGALIMKTGRATLWDNSQFLDGAQRTFDAIRFFDFLTEPIHIGVREVLDALIRVDPGGFKNATARHAPDAVDVGEADFDLFLPGEIDACNTSHG